jgi:hypothetical protein
MKKVSFSSKLNFNKKTIAKLNETESAAIRGGVGTASDGTEEAAFLSIVTCKIGKSHCRHCDSCCKGTSCSRR